MKVYFPEFNRERVVEHVKKRMRRLKASLPIKTIALFGSYAEDRHTVSSDIDLLVVYDDPKRGDAYHITWEKLGLPQLQLHMYTASEYEKLKRGGSKFPEEIEKKGIIIYNE